MNITFLLCSQIKQDTVALATMGIYKTIGKMVRTNKHNRRIYVAVVTNICQM